MNIDLITFIFLISFMVALDIIQTATRGDEE